VLVASTAPGLHTPARSTNTAFLIAMSSNTASITKSASDRTAADHADAPDGSRRRRGGLGHLGDLPLGHEHVHQRLALRTGEATREQLGLAVKPLVEGKLQRRLHRVDDARRREQLALLVLHVLARRLHRGARRLPVVQGARVSAAARRRILSGQRPRPGDRFDHGVVGDAVHEADRERRIGLQATPAEHEVEGGLGTDEARRALTALTISSTTFFASPKTIIVLSM
jgi:hypothetical protein